MLSKGVQKLKREVDIVNWLKQFRKSKAAIDKLIVTEVPKSQDSNNGLAYVFSDSSNDS